MNQALSFFLACFTSGGPQHPQEISSSCFIDKDIDAKNQYCSSNVFQKNLSSDLSDSVFQAVLF
jgi:hypothetical protein